MSEGVAALRLLVIDDNAQMRELVGAVLGAAGVRSVFFAYNGRQGLDMISSHRPDIVYVDYEMPVLNGLDFVTAVRGLPSPDRFIPIIMLTGYSDLVRLKLARDSGVTEFVAKPVSAKTLLDRLQAVILHPRPFIRNASFFGPDRRRKRIAAYEGPQRRASDRTEFTPI